MASLNSGSNMQRSSSSSGSGAPSGQKQKVHHLRHVQHIPEAVEPAPQDPEFAEGQLLKSIGAALTLAGFDSVKPTALEMFRAHTEECKYTDL
jgi:transcription initiation factor TFIID subunit 8